ncbi:VG15 protein [Pseudoscardovia suis]
MVDLRPGLDAYGDAQNAAVARAIDAMESLWRSVTQLATPQEQRDALLELVPALAGKYGDVAAAAAAQWYEESRSMVLGDDDGFVATLGPGFPSQAVQDSIRWKAGVLWNDPGQMRVFLSSAMDRWVKYSGRMTVIENTGRDPQSTRWALVPRGKTCAWCTMLASRDWAYTSEDTAKASMHPHCDCQPVPLWDARREIVSGYDPEAMLARVQAAERRLDEGIDGGWAAAGSRESQVAEVMRRLDPDEYTDGVHDADWVTGGHSRASVGDVNLGAWHDYRASLAERYITLNDQHAKMPPERPAKAPKLTDNDGKQLDVQLTEKAWNHLLYGSRNQVNAGEHYSGGHMAGYGWIHDGTEFPQSMNESDIAEALSEACGQVIDRGGFESGANPVTVNGRQAALVVSKRRNGTIMINTFHMGGPSDARRFS